MALKAAHTFPWCLCEIAYAMDNSHRSTSLTLQVFIRSTRELTYIKLSDIIYMRN